MFKYIVSKERLIIVSVIIFISYISYNIYNISKISISPTQDILFAISMSFIAVLGVFWVTYFNKEWYRVIPFYLFLFLSSFVFVVVLRRIMDNSDLGFRFLGIFVFGIIISLILYLIMGTINILIVSYTIRKIPMEQVAKVSLLLFSLITVNLSYNLLFSSNIQIFFFVLIAIIINAIVIFANFLIIRLRTKEYYLMSISTNMSITMLAITFLMWATPISIIAFFITVVFYLLLSLGIDIRKEYKVVSFVEMVLFIFLGLFFVFAVSDWGILGTIL